MLFQKNCSINRIYTTHNERNPLQHNNSILQRSTRTCKPLSKSILNQEWKECLYEVIFINDGSKIHINKSTRDLFEKFSLFTLIEQENQGLSAARNAGIKVAKGKYLFFVDSDDYWFDYKIHELTPLIKISKYDIIKFQTVHIYDNQPPHKQTHTQPVVNTCNSTTS